MEVMKVEKKIMQGVEFSHFLLKQQIKPGDTVIDATAGNGYDTLFLAKLVGDNGNIFAFDIQKKAINRTKETLVENNLLNRVKLICDGHENLNNYFNNNTVDGIIFNLGYLPNSDKKITTQPQTTLTAVKSSLTFLCPGGLITIVVYSEHQGGREEKQALLKLTQKLHHKRYNVLHYHFVNQKKEPPQVLAIKKRK